MENQESALENKALIHIAETLDIEELSTLPSYHEKFLSFANYIDELINTDFNRLVSILYRIDVSEQKLRNTLTSNHNNRLAGELIAELIIEREVQKIKFRNEYSKK